MHRGWSQPSALLLFPVIFGCGSGDPFNYVKVSGKVTYTDGSLIPADRVVVTFFPQRDAPDPATCPRPGVAEVDVKTGRFDCVSSHKYGDGIVGGKHKVTICSLTRQQSPTSHVPAEYKSADKTPLVIDSHDAPFEFRVPKPR